MEPGAPGTPAAPARKRRRRRWIYPVVGAPLVLLLLALGLVIAPFLLARIPKARDLALDVASFRSLLGAEGRLRVDDVVRLDPWGFEVAGVTLETRVGTTYRTWARVARIQGRYRPGDLLTRSVVVAELRLDSVRVELDRVPPGLLGRASRAASPDSATGVPRAKPARSALLPAIRCDSLVVSRVALRRDARSSIEFEGRFGGLSHFRTRLEGTLARARLSWPRDSLTFLLSGGEFHGKLMNRLRCDSLLVQTDAGEALLSCDWVDDGTSGRRDAKLRGDVSLERFSPLALRWLRGSSLPLESSDAIAGRLRFRVNLEEARAPRGQVDVRFGGQLFGTSIDTLALFAVGGRDTTDVHRLVLQSGELRIDGRGQVRPAARGLRGDLEFQRLDLAGDLVRRFAPGLPSSRLSGQLEGELTSIGQDLSLVIALRTEPGRLLERPVPSLALAAHGDRVLLLLDSLRMGASEDPLLRATGSMAFDARTLQVRADLLGLDLETWLEPWVGLGVSGRVTGEASVAGPLRSPTIAGSLHASEGQIEGVSIDSVWVSGLSGGLAPFDVTASVGARGLDVYGLPFDHAEARARFGRTIAATIAATRDTIGVRLCGEVRPGFPGWVRVDSLEVVPGSLPAINLAAPLQLKVEKQEVRIDSLRLASALGSVRGRGVISPRPEAPGNDRFSFDLEARDLDFGRIGGFFGLPSDSLNGQGGIDVSGEGTLLAPRFRLAIDASALETYGWVWYDVHAALGAGELEPGRSIVVIDTLRMEGLGYLGRLPRLVPELVGPAAPAPPVRFQADSLRIAIDRPWRETLPALRDSVWALLRDARLRANLRADDVPVLPFLARALAPRGDRDDTRSLVEPLNPMSEIIRIARPDEKATRLVLQRGLGGTVSAGLRVAGTGVKPRFELELEGRKLEVFEARADSLFVTARYEDARLELRAFDWYLRGARARSYGEIPLRLELSPTPARLVKRPIDLTTELPEIDLALATLVSNLIVEPEGRLDGRIHWRGVAPRVFPEGHLSVTDGAFRIPNREERLTKVRAELELDSLGVRIVEAEGRANETGRVRVRGRYKSDRDFDLVIEARDTSAFETGNYRFVADADLRAHPTADGDTLRPLLSGEVRISEGLITMDLTKPQAGGVLRTPWLIDLSVKAPVHLRLVDPVTNAELAIDSLSVTYRQPLWNLGGDVDIVSGQYRVFNKSFRVTSGTVTFNDDGTGPHPTLDLQAETRLPDVEQNQDIVIFLNVSGEAGRIGPDGLPIPPVISLSSMPEMDEAEIIRRLSFGQLTSNQTKVGTQYVQGEVFGRLEQQLIGRLPWADRVLVQSSFDESTPWSVQVRPIVGRQWSVAFTQEIVATARPQISVNYRLSNLLFLNAATGEDRTNAAEPEDTYTLDLRFRVEY